MTSKIIFKERKGSNHGSNTQHFFPSEFLELNFLVDWEQLGTIKLIIYQKGTLSTFLLILMRFQQLLHGSVIIKGHLWKIGQY